MPHDTRRSAAVTDPVPARSLPARWLTGIRGRCRPGRSPVSRFGRWLAVAGILLLAGRAGLALLREPCVGVADNNDYWRVAEPAGIEAEQAPDAGYYVVCRYETSEADLLSSLTSPALVAWLARHLPAGTGDTFDLRQLGLIYWLLSLGVLIGGSIGGSNVYYLLMIAWIAYDPGYSLFFNSLYAEPALLVGLTAVLVVLLLDPLSQDRMRYGISAWSSLVVAAVLAGASKMQYSTFPAIVLFCAAASFAIRRSRPRRSQYAAMALLAAIAGLIPIHFFYGNAPRFPDTNNFNAVFGGIARVSSEPIAAMEALGIPPSQLERQPRDFFSAPREVIAPALPYVRELSRVRLAGLYLLDSHALARTALEIHTDLARVRTHPRGNYTQPESGRRARHYRTRVQFSRWRSALLRPVPFWSYLLLTVTGVFLVCQAVRRRWGAADTAFLFLVVWSGSQFVVVILGDGFVNLHQHLVGARLGVDFLLGLGAVRIARWGFRALASAGGRGSASRAEPAQG